MNMKNVVIKKLKVAVAFIFAVSFIVMMGWGYYVLLADNFGTVQKGLLYRSAQPDEDDIENDVQKYGIKSIINLRGQSDSGWYKEEIAASKKFNLSHYDIDLSVFNQPSQEQMLQIVQLLKNAPKPILVHCMEGADRTGLVSAIFEYTIAGMPAKEAKKNLSILHGHLPYFGSKTIAMDRAFDAFVTSNLISLDKIKR